MRHRGLARYRPDDVSTALTRPQKNRTPMCARTPRLVLAETGSKQRLQVGGRIAIEAPRYKALGVLLARYREETNAASVDGSTVTKLWGAFSTNDWWLH